MISIFGTPNNKKSNNDKVKDHKNFILLRNEDTSDLPSGQQ